MIEVPFGAEYYTLRDDKSIGVWFKKSDGVILQCGAPKTPCTPQYLFWEVSAFPRIRVLGDAFGSGLHCVHELGVEGKDWMEMPR